MNSSNSTFNNASSVPYFPVELKVTKLASAMRLFVYSNILPFVLSAGSFWNLLIIIYFVKINIKNLKKMSSYHFLIINLAVADLCTCFGTPITLHFYLKPSWELGAFGCTFMSSFIFYICPMVSCWLLVLISFARFWSIMYPLRARINKKKYGLACLSIWIITSLSNVYYFITNKIKQSQDGPRCWDASMEGSDVVQPLITIFLDSFLPFAIMLFLYHKMEKRLNAEENENSFALNDQSRQRNRRALRTIRGLIWLFILTVILGRVYNLLSRVLDFYKSNNKPPFLTMLDVFIWVSYSLNVLIYFMNNILNIFIYAKMIPDFRRFLLTVFTFGMYGKRNAIN